MDGSKLCADLMPRLHNLKVDELKNVCREVGLRLSGRKQDLLDRIHSCIREGSFASRQRLHDSLVRRLGAVPTNRSVPSSSSSAPPRLAPDAPLAAAAQPDRTIRCLCSSQFSHGLMIACDECDMWQHCACIGIQPHAVPDSYVCARCRSTTLDPFLEVDASFQGRCWLVPGANSLQMSGMVQPNTTRESVTISTAMTSELASGVRQLVLRTFLANPGAKRNHRWPLRSSLALNGTATPIVQQPQAWDGISCKDRNEDEPLALPRSQLRFAANTIALTSYDPVAHIAVCQLVRPVGVEELAALVRARTPPLAHALANVRRVFGGDGGEDDDVIAGASRVTMQCPLSHRRVSTPVRSERCRHVECFDLDSYLQLARSTRFPRWQCPKCNAPARPSQLQIDPWMAGLLADFPPSCLEVDVEPDGSASLVQPSSQSGGRKRKVEAISIDIGGDEDNPICLDDDD